MLRTARENGGFSVSAIRSIHRIFWTLVDFSRFFLFYNNKKVSKLLT